MVLCMYRYVDLHCHICAVWLHCIMKGTKKCKPSADAQLLAHGAWLAAWVCARRAMGAIINTHVHR